MSRPPMICKMPLDLYRVYTSVQQHGGFLNVSIAVKCMYVTVGTGSVL